jgi:hypothetical protein
MLANIFGACKNIPTEEKIKTKPDLSILALISFISAFAIARAFSSFYPQTILEISGFHIHHFWYGLIMIVIGGWLGISVENERINRVAAILYGAGGGIIGDEVGLLLTFGNYWTEVTYTFVIIFIAFASALILLFKYSKTITTEFTQFLRSNVSLYLGVFLAAVSVAFISQTNNLTVIAVFSALAILGVLIILTSFIHKIVVKKSVDAQTPENA